MALLFTDGFDDGLVTQKWLSLESPPAIVTGRHGSGIQLIDREQRLEKTITPSVTVICGFALNIAESFVSNMSTAPFYYYEGIVEFVSDAGLTRQVLIITSPSGAIQIMRGTKTIVATSTRTLNLNEWNYIEVKVTVADSGGSCTVRVNGQEWVTYTGDTRDGGTSANIDLVALRSGAYNTSQRPNRNYDDFYICDTSGTVNNDFLGDIRVETLLPSGNGSSSQFVGSDGDSADNYLLVDEAGTPVTTDYVSSGTVGQRDLYAFADSTAMSGIVKGVQVNAYAAKSDSALRTVSGVVRSGGVDSVSVGDALQTTYSPHLSIHEVDPATGAAWTVDGVNNAEYGVEVES